VVCGGDFIEADHIRFTDTVFRNSKRIGSREFVALVLEIDGPGQDDWIVLEVVHCEGDQPEPEGLHFRRKRKNVERNGVIRRLWDDESVRTALLDGTP